ncbi:DUF2079 domain-containing protein [Streptomyces erythrochromogenes]|uniref:DUF2079 domain-containing protein n=1 Tax=Streptomyces erythrochromogenes TaxID=285574 RepID=UPI0037F94E07
MDVATAAIPAQHGSAPTPAPGVSKTVSRRSDPYWLAGLFFAAYSVLSVCRFRRLGTMTWDLGIFEQAIRAYANLQPPIVDLKGQDFNILGDHFSPVTMLVAPFYRLSPNPVTLLVVQAALFAVSVIPVARGAGYLLGRSRGIAIGVAYGLSWGVQRAVDFDFHEIAFAMPLIAFSLEAVLCKRWKAAMWWALPLVLVKEDLGVTLAAIGLVILLLVRRDAPRLVPWAIGLIGFGLVFAVITFGVIIPAFNSAGSYAYWTKLSGEGTAAYGRTIPPDTALRTLLWIIAPTSGLLAVRSPLLLAAVPTIGWRFLGRDDHYWGLDWHYSAILMPVLLLALVDAVNRSRNSHRSWLRCYSAQLPAAVAGAALALSAYLPLADLTRSSTYQPGARAEAVFRLFQETIPDGATVEADVGPISLLTNRCRVFWLGNVPGLNPDFITYNSAVINIPDGAAYARQTHPGATYMEIARAEGYVILRRV